MVKKIDLDNVENNKWYQVFTVMRILNANYIERKNFREPFAAYIGTTAEDQKPKYLKIFFMWFTNRKLVLEFLEYDCQNII